jgi:DNA/RNA endonuclease G (NUC1)
VGILRSVPPEIFPNRFLPAINEINVNEIKRIGRVAVPEKCWKVIYIKSTKEWRAFLFINDTSKPDGYSNNEVDVKVIEKLTGLKFK